MPKRILHVATGLVVFAMTLPHALAQSAPPAAPPPQTAPLPDAAPRVKAKAAPVEQATSATPATAEPAGTSGQETGKEGADAPARSTVPGLARVMELARDRAPAAVVARANVEIGRSALVGARLGPVANPYVEVLADRGSAGATRDLTVQGSLWVPVEVSGQREKREAEAQALVAWAGAEAKATRASAVADAVRAYGQLVVADARIRALDELSEVARAEAAYYDGRVQAGDATELDAKLAEVELARHAVALAEGRADRARALAAVGLATGNTYTDAPADGPAPPAPKAASVASSPVRDAATLPAVQASAAQATYHAREKDRYAIEAHAPLNLVVTVGRGDLGEVRVGGGIAWSLPVLRTNQGEQARAEASRSKATIERDLKARIATTTADGLTRERAEIRKAIETITGLAEPAAKAAVDAAVAMEQAGKGDLLRVLTARRDLALLKSRRLDLLQREWNLVGDLVALTGDLP